MNKFFTKRDSNGYVEIRLGRIITLAAIALLVLILVTGSFSKIPTGYTGIVTTFGRVENYTFDPGIHFKAPWQSVVKMDNRIQKHTIELSCFSQDIQEVNIKYTLNYQISSKDAMTIYATIGKDYFDTVITPNISEAVKVCTAKYTAESLVNDRSDLARVIEDFLTDALKNYNIFVIGTSIEDIDFTDAFTDAVEAKQVAQQNKLRAETEQAQATMEAEAKAKRDIIAAKAKAEQDVIAANADLEVVKIQSEASLYAGQREAEMNARIAENLTDDLISYYWIKQWNGLLPSTVLGSDGNYMFNLGK
jgi:regulator of protease activity HflC (stomatin/prohibitin superfamily)